MNNCKRMIGFIICIVLGVVLILLGQDSYWSGMGTSLIVVGALRLFHWFFYHRNDDYREKKQIEATDERNQFLRSRAWAWTGYLFILVSAVCSIVFKVLGQDLLSMAAGLAVCLMMVIHWICYIILRKKY